MQAEETEKPKANLWLAGFDDYGCIIAVKHGCGNDAHPCVETGREMRWVCPCGAELSHIELYRLADRRGR